MSIKTHLNEIFSFFLLLKKRRVGIRDFGFHPTTYTNLTVMLNISCYYSSICFLFQSPTWLFFIFPSKILLLGNIVKCFIKACFTADFRQYRTLQNNNLTLYLFAAWQ